MELPAGTVRDGLAAERTVLAAERTLLAWVRTSFALLVTGIAGSQFLEQTPWVVVGWVVFMLASFAILLLGALRYRNSQRRVRGMFARMEVEGGDGPPPAPGELQAPARPGGGGPWT